MTTILCHKGRLAADTRVSTVYGPDPDAPGTHIVHERRQKIHVTPHVAITGAGCTHTLLRLQNIWTLLWMRFFRVGIGFHIRPFRFAETENSVFAVWRRGKLWALSIKTIPILGFFALFVVTKTQIRKDKTLTDILVKSGTGGSELPWNVFVESDLNTSMSLAPKLDVWTGNEWTVFNLTTWRFENLPPALPPLGPRSVRHIPALIKSLVTGQGFLRYREHDTTHRTQR